MEEQTEYSAGKSDKNREKAMDIIVAWGVTFLLALIISFMVIAGGLGSDKFTKRTVIATVHPEEVTENLFGMKNYSITFTYEEINDKTHEHIYEIYTVYGRENYYKYKDCKEITMTLVTNKTNSGNGYALRL